jgi:hypothetical protein
MPTDPQPLTCTVQDAAEALAPVTSALGDALDERRILLEQLYRTTGLPRREYGEMVGLQLSKTDRLVIRRRARDEAAR